MDLVDIWQTCIIVWLYGAVFTAMFIMWSAYVVFNTYIPSSRVDKILEAVEDPTMRIVIVIQSICFILIWPISWLAVVCDIKKNGW